MNEIIVAVHGYSQNVPPGYRPWKDVVNDRLTTTLKAAKFFEKLGCDVEIVICGGKAYEGKKEADTIYEYAQANFSEINNFDVNLEKESEKSEESVGNIYRMVEKAEAVVPVTSIDHISRVLGYFAYHSKRPPVEKTLILGSPSKEPYSEKGWTTPPAIVEPSAKFGDVNLAETVPKFFKVPKEKRVKFANDIEELLRKY